MGCLKVLWGQSRRGKLTLGELNYNELKQI